MFSSNTSQVSGESSDPQFNYVTMLLHGDGTNGAQNNTFLDSSTNNFTITRNGNTTQGSFSPYGANWSVSGFAANGGSLQAPSTAGNFGSSDWTVEFWVNTTSGDGPGIVTQATAGGATNTSWGFFVGYGTSKNVALYLSDGSSYFAAITAGTSPVADGKWHHVAASRSGSTAYLFLDGVLQGTTSVGSTALGNGTLPVHIGGQGTGTSYMLQNGYISNVRIVKGTALYTSAFTPSTTPLTAVSGTSLLTCQSNRFIDNSANNFTITVNGNTSVQRFSPFAPSAAYSTATIGGSGYFDGSGDYLDIDSTSTFDFGTGDLTIEFWAKPNAATNYQGVVCVTYNGGNPNNGYLIVELSPARGLFVNADAFSTEVSSTAAYPAYENAWHHWAVTRASGTWKIFKDGVSQTLATNTIGSANFTGTTGVIVGAQVGSGSSPAYYPFNGNLSDVRIVKGTALYTANFTPPTAPLSAVTNTQLLLNFTNAGIFDNAMMNDLETVGNAQISTSVKKYGTGSIAFDGNGDYLQSPVNNDLKFGTGDFTVEFWMNANSLPAAVWRLFCTDTGGWTANTLVIGLGYTGAGRLFLTVGSAMAGVGGSTTLSTGTWYHVALTRSGTAVKLFLNGVQEISGTSSADLNFGQAFIGGFYSGGEYFNGYIDDLRITKGYARYTANFTPPAAAFPNN